MKPLRVVGMSRLRVKATRALPLSSNKSRRNQQMPAAIMRDSVDALLFDLGNVVIEIDFNRALTHWAAHARCEAGLIKDRFRHDHAYDQHERGKIDLNAYLSALRANLGVEISDAQLRQGWNSILIGEVPGMSALLARAAERFPLYAFTNSNPEHQACLAERFSDLLRPFRQVFVSSRIGLRKPEPEAYRYVVDAIGVPAKRILFFDDLIENVDGARACGLQAVHVRTSADVRDVLSGLLTGPAQSRYSDPHERASRLDSVAPDSPSGAG
jgi:putative hydrolase of the HAD superfamily